MSQIAQAFHLDSERDYLQELDNTEPAKQYPLVQKWLKSEPLPFFKQLRQERPILVTEECTLVSRFTDVRDMLQMPKVFTVALYRPKMGVTDTDPGYLMAHDDDALHYREKSLMQGMLNREDLPRVRKLISDTCVKVLNNAPNELDIIHHYCRSVPATLVQEYFGLDDIDNDKLIEWSFWNQYDAFHNQPFDLNSAELYQHIIDEHDRVSGELEKYIAKTLARKLALVKLEQAKNILLVGWRVAKAIGYKISGKKAPRLNDDIFARMLRSSFAKEVDFPLTRVAVNAGGLLIGSIETTSQAVSQVISFFLQDPELLEQARIYASTRESTQFDNMVWEALRFTPISPYMFRQTAEEYTLAKGTDYETTIPANTNVLALTQSAMFDEYAYTRPEEFNPDRNWYHHFNYGFATHECLGKYVGMEMIPEMVRQIIRLPNIQEKTAIDYKEGPFPESYTLTWG